LQQSIDKEIKTFTANFSLNNATTWLATEQKVKQAKPSAIKTNINSLPLTSN
jgi:hypothetical protein